MRTRSRSVVAGMLALALGTAALAGEEWALPRIVKFEGVKSCFNYSRSCIGWGTAPREGWPGAMLAADGDLLFFSSEDGFLLPYRSTDGASLTLKADGFSLRLGGKVVSLVLSDEEKKAGGWPWLEKASAEELAGLRTVDLSESPKAERMGLVRKLAAANPSVGLLLKEEETVWRVLPLFKPTWLFADVFSLGRDDPALAASLQDVATLVLAGDDGGKDAKKKASFDFLSRMPRLRRLITPWDPEATGPLPESCRSLRALTAISPKAKDLSGIARLTELRELYVFGGDELSDVGALAGLAELRALSLVGCKNVTDLSVLKALPELRWLELPPTATQEQLAAAVQEHPSLAVVALVKCEKITDVAPLKGLKGLWGLVLVETPAPLAPLGELKSLRFLALDKKVFEETPVQVAMLVKALPDCTIVEGGGFCLGSGWVLLLLPAGLAAWLMARRRRRPAHA